jgi:hypothetical protein
MASVGGASGKAESQVRPFEPPALLSLPSIADVHGFKSARPIGRKAMASLLDDPSHWRACAKEARSVAGLMTDFDARKTLLSIAASYDALADHAEKRLANQTDQQGRNI